MQWTKRLSSPVCNLFFHVVGLGELKICFRIAYASIGSEMNELQNTSWIATSYLLTTTSIVRLKIFNRHDDKNLFRPLYGKLSDIFGRKTCLLFAYTVFAVGCLLCGLSRNMTELVASRALSGIGGGGMQT